MFIVIWYDGPKKNQRSFDSLDAARYLAGGLRIDGYEGVRVCSADL